VRILLCFHNFFFALVIFISGAFFMPGVNRNGMSITESDIRYMQRAVKLSQKGKYYVRPNPLVGAVIVENGKITGEGYHEKFGGPHAEINAITNADKPLQGATMYVTLEPCSHYGKTPPCADRLISEGFSRVVIGMADPNPVVNGKGIEKLKTAGIEVEVPVLEEEIRKVNEIYLTNIREKRPFCVLKTAMTLDGKIATKTGDSKWISGEKSREYVHELRHLYDGIMVGVNTVISDDPELTDRSPHNEKRHPVRIITDSTGRIPLDSKVLRKDDIRTIIAVTERVDSEFIGKIYEKGKEVVVCPEKNGRVDLKFLIKELWNQGIDSVLIEGGSTLNYSAVSDGIVDKVLSFISPKIVGGEESLTPVGGAGVQTISDAFRLKVDKVEQIDSDILIESYIIR